MRLDLPVLIPLISILFCVTAGLTVFRRIQGPTRLLIVHAICASIITVVGWISSRLNPGHSNQILYNFYLPVDFFLMLLAARGHFNKHFRIIAAGGTLLFLVAWLLSMASSGIYKLANQAIVVYAAVLTVVYFLVLLRNAQQESSRYTTGIYCVAISVMLYYCCVIPYFGFMHYIYAQDVKLAGRLHYIVNALSCLRYIFTGIGIILLSRSTSPAIHAYK